MYVQQIPIPYTRVCRVCELMKYLQGCEVEVLGLSHDAEKYKTDLGGTLYDN